MRRAVSQVSKDTYQEREYRENEWLNVQKPCQVVVAVAVAA